MTNQTENNSKYWESDDGKLMIVSWLSRGLNDKEIAERIGVSEKTLSRWKRKDTLKGIFAMRRDLIISKAEESLKKSSTGYFVDETKVIVGADGRPQRIEKNHRYIKPDVNATMFVLQNMAPEIWKNIKTVEKHVELLSGLDKIIKDELDLQVGKHE